MAYGLPVRGQIDWDDEINNSIAAIKSTADTASSSASAAVSTANSAASSATAAAASAAQSATAAETAAASASAPTDDAVAAAVADEASATSAALSGTYGPSASQMLDAFPGRVTPTQHAPAFGLYFPAAEGAVFDGTTDDTLAIQATVDAAPAGSTVIWPEGGNALTTAPISVTTAGLTFRGSAMYHSRIYADGCNGVEVASGVSSFRMEGMEVACKVRYSTTPNTLVGILVEGSTASRPSNHIYRDVYVDGFHTAFRSDYLWSSRFDNFRTGFGLIGIDAYGLSVNNVVADSNINVSIVAGSRGIRLIGQESVTDTTDVASEGWTVHDSIIFGGEYGVDIIGSTHNDIHDNIIDFCQMYGVRIRDNGTNFGGNSDIHDNYIAMTGTAGVAAVDSANTVSNAANTVNRIHHNHCVVYSGGTCTNGIYVSGSNGNAHIDDNVLRGFGADIRLQITGQKVTGNACKSAVATHITGINGHVHLIANNEGNVYLPGGGTSPFSYTMVGKVKIALGIAAPTVNTWVAGDRVINGLPAVGSPKGWVCTVGGTPGTWVSEGNL